MLKSEIRKKREQEIILSLNKLGIMTCDMFMKLNISGLGESSKRNTLRVLNRMVKDGFLDEKRKDVKMFVVKGRGFGYYEHDLMRNKFIINKGMYKRVRIEPNIKIGNDQFRPDFIYPIVNNAKTEKDWCFYEVDRTQKMKVNYEKIERYKRLGLRFEVICPSHRIQLWKGCVVHEI